jgi:hypothetical protein
MIDPKQVQALITFSIALVIYMTYSGYADRIIEHMRMRYRILLGVTGVFYGSAIFSILSEFQFSMKVFEMHIQYKGIAMVLAGVFGTLIIGMIPHYFLWKTYKNGLS